EVLRTTFAVSAGEPIQVIHQAEPMALPMIDLAFLDESDREAQAQETASIEARRWFDLEGGPLIRATLLRMSERDHVLLLIMHHIVMDGWSVGVLTREVAALYDAYLKGETSPLADLPIQYADFARWQREWLSGERLEGQLEYWKRHLAGELPALELPTDRARPPMQTFRGATVHFTLS